MPRTYKKLDANSLSKVEEIRRRMLEKRGLQPSPGPPDQETSVAKLASTAAGKVQIKDALEAEGIDPVKELLDLYRHGDLSDKDRKGLMENLVKYISPTLKSVEMKSEAKQDIRIVVAHYKLDEDGNPTAL